MKHVAYIALGSNLGDRESYLRDAVRLLQDHPLIHVLAVSHFYETEPLTLKNEKQNWFLNCAAKIKTSLNPIRLFQSCQEIEHLLGRIRSEKWGPRTLDLDLLFFDDEILKTKTLCLPHPELQNRRFVLEPLAEIAPTLKHPVKGLTIQALLRNLKDNKKVVPLYRFQLSHSSAGILPDPLRERG